MKRQLLILVLLFITLLKSYSQIRFESGYFIDDAGQRVECLIKNVEWKNNPTEFDYKLTQDAAIQRTSIQNVKEFGISGGSKYVRALVKIDRSSDNLNYISSERNPVFREEQLFLHVLIEGSASLFLYEEGSLTRFFYRTSTSDEINQLVYKKYMVNGQVALNSYFKQQLLLDLVCSSATMPKPENVDYRKSDLKRFFIKYNECVKSDYVDYAPKQKRDMFNLSIRPGLNFSSLSIHNSLTSTWDTDFGNKLGFRLGVEGEFVLRFNKSKWSIIVEPTYQSFSSEKTTESNSVVGGLIIAKVNYKSVELPIGLRHYFFLNDDAKVFANISLIIDFNKKSSIEFTRANGTSLNSVDINSRNNAAFGIGYKFKNRYSFELRYQTSRQILGEYLAWESKYNTVSTIVGFTLF